MRVVEVWASLLVYRLSAGSQSELPELQRHTQHPPSVPARRTPTSASAFVQPQCPTKMAPNETCCSSQTSLPLYLLPPRPPPSSCWRASPAPCTEAEGVTTYSYIAPEIVRA